MTQLFSGGGVLQTALWHCGFYCGCGWYVIPDTQYTLTRKHHFSARTLYSDTSANEDNSFRDQIR